MKHIKLIFMVIILLFDLFLIPYLLQLPLYFKKFGVKAAGMWLHDFSLTSGIKKLINDPAFAKMWLVVQPMIIVLIILMFWRDNHRKRKDLKGVGGPDAAGSGQFGTSRWLTEEEMDKVSTVFKMKEGKLAEKKLGVITKGGMVLGYDKENAKAWVDTADTHSLIIGTSRSGKTRTFLFPTIWEIAQAGESMILNDPKGEIYETTHQHLKDMGYDIVLLDFRDTSRGNRWNPMNLIVEAIKKGDKSLASEAAWDMAHTIVYQKSRTGDPIWAQGAESVIAALSLAVASDAPKDIQKHLTSVYHMLTELGEPIKTKMGDFVPLNEYFRNLPRGNLAKSAFGTASLSADKTRAGFFTGAAADLRLFSDPGVANLTSSQDHELAAIGLNKTAVFMIVPDEKSTRHVLASLYIDQTYQALVDLASQYNDRLPVRVNMLLDEFGNMPPINDFDNKITVSAGRGIKYTLIVQDFGQLKEKYGKKESIIKGNCHIWMYLLTTDISTAKELSEKTGKYTVETQSYSSSYQSRNVNTQGVSSGLTGRPLLTHDEILRWPYGNALVFLARQHPAHLPLPDITEWPVQKAFPMVYQSKGSDTPRERKKIQYNEIVVWVPGFEGEIEDDPEGNHEDNQGENTSQNTSSILHQLDNATIEVAVTQDFEETTDSPSDIEVPHDDANAEIDRIDKQEEEVVIPVEEIEDRMESKEDSSLFSLDDLDDPISFDVEIDPTVDFDFSSLNEIPNHEEQEKQNSLTETTKNNVPKGFCLNDID